MQNALNVWIVAALAWAAGGCEAMPADIAVPENYRRVSVADFGAIPDDGKDDSAAVAKALAAAADRPGSVLVLPKGRYDFRHDRRPGRGIYHFPVRGARGLMIDGRGSKLIFSGKTAPFSFTDCQDVAVMNLTIDWDEPIYSAGIITKSAPRSFEVALDVEYTGEGRERIENVIEWDPRTHLPLAGGAAIGDLPEAPHKNIQPPRKTGPKTLRVDLNVDRKMTEGAYVVLVHQNYVYNAFSVSESRGVRFQDVTIHYTPGMAFFCRRATDLLFRRVRVEPRPGSGRILSISADAVHCADCAGTVTIADCTFQGMGDDAANIHGTYYDIASRPADDAIEVTCKGTWKWLSAAGEVLEFTDPATLLPYGEARIKEMTFDPRTHRHRVAFDGPVPDRLKVGDYAANATMVAKARVRGNRVVGNRARGFVIKTRDAIVENNTFESVDGAGIFVAVEGKFWREAIGTRDVIVRDNTFTNCNGGPSRSWGVIAVFALLEGQGHRMGPAGVHRRLRIEGNTIAGTDNCGIYVSSTDGAVIRGNSIRDCCRKPSRPGGTHAIYLLNCRDVTIARNKLTSPGPGMAEPLGLGGGVDSGALTLRDNAGIAMPNGR